MTTNGQLEDPKHFAARYARALLKVLPLASNVDDATAAAEMAVEADPTVGLEEPSIQLAVQHAPEGGVTIGGTFYAGGEFIPGEVLAKTTPEEKSAIAGGQESTNTWAPGGRENHAFENISKNPPQHKIWDLLNETAKGAGVPEDRNSYQSKGGSQYWSAELNGRRLEIRVANHSHHSHQEVLLRNGHLGNSIQLTTTLDPDQFKEKLAYTLNRIKQFAKPPQSTTDSLDSKSAEELRPIARELGIKVKGLTLDTLKEEIKKKANEQGKKFSIAPETFSVIDSASRPINLPDIPQEHADSCQESLWASICRYFAVAPVTEKEWIKELGWTDKTAIDPEGVMEVLSRTGLQIEARENMTIEDLARFTQAGAPVGIYVQEYGKTRIKGARWTGHVVGVCDVIPGYVIVQDPSITNILKNDDSDDAAGKCLITHQKLMEKWHVKDKDGKEWTRFGIAVHPPDSVFFAVQHAPEGGVTIGGTFYKGGEFIPDEVIEKATAEEKTKLGGSSPKESKSGKSKASVSVISYPEAAQKNLKELFSGKVRLEDLASLVGAPDDAEVSVSPNDSWHEGSLNIYIDSPDIEAERRIARDSSGKLYMENVTIKVKEGSQKTGIGSKLFAAQVKQAQELGFSYIRCHAAAGAKYNGYYTWPRMGYDASLYDVDDDKRKEAQKKFPGARTILDVMQTKEGRQWWKENGEDLLDAKFDLSPNSRSMQIHSAYMEERSRNG